jgi:hypothetical protein
VKKFAERILRQISCKPLAGLLLLVVMGLAWPGCTEVENQRPVSDFENSTGPLPLFDLRLDSTGSKTIRFDSIAQGGNFSLTFTPLTFGKIRIVEGGKAVQIQMEGRNWRKDSTEYTIIKNKTSRKGKIVMINFRYIKPDSVFPIDTSCQALPVRIIFVPFNVPVEIKNLFPFNGKGKIDSLKTLSYSATKQGDSSIVFTSQGVQADQLWAWDTISYQLKATNRKCWRGKIAVVLGDTCESGARDDIFSLPSANALWSETILTQNDRGCSGLLGQYLTRTATDFDYGNFKIMPTLNGILTDTLVDGNQFYKYERTNSGASGDQFVYYFKNLNTNRVTKATVKITF